MKMDWQKWMEDHHVKMRGDPDDDGTDEVLVGRQISGTEVETKMPNNARATGDCAIQQPVIKTKEES